MTTNGENIANPQLKPLANTLIVLREDYDDWAILFNPDDGQSFVLNPVSVFIWKRLDGKHTASDMVSEIRNRFLEVPEHAEASVRVFMEALIDRGYAGCELL